MLENLRLKFHAFKLRRQSASQHDDRMPVNPYAKPLPIAKSKLNPYSTDYGSQRAQEHALAKIMRIFGGRARNKDTLDATQYPTIHGGKHVGHIPGMVEIVPVNAGPTFVDDMRRQFAEDMLFIASRIHFPAKAEKKMSSEEIAKACERLQW